MEMKYRWYKQEIQRRGRSKNNLLFSAFLERVMIGHYLVIAGTTCRGASFSLLDQKNVRKLEHLSCSTAQGERDKKRSMFVTPTCAHWCHAETHSHALQVNSRLQGLLFCSFLFGCRSIKGSRFNIYMMLFIYCSFSTQSHPLCIQ